MYEEVEASDTADADDWADDLFATTSLTAEQVDLATDVYIHAFDESLEQARRASGDDGVSD